MAMTMVDGDIQYAIGRKIGKNFSFRQHNQASLSVVSVNRFIHKNKYTYGQLKYRKEESKAISLNVSIPP